MTNHRLNAATLMLEYEYERLKADLQILDLAKKNMRLTTSARVSAKKKRSAWSNTVKSKPAWQPSTPIKYDRGKPAPSSAPIHPQRVVPVVRH